ncbi:hypothetical protein VP01_3032g1 [Puccinia sorghi]|uniref:Uncharacterized protein n=1 Tax=Puccinia sorghi TaxID=27349 RepID=A0A0L6V026_9BASI|nr:hypothetical protein VP01_3032g1 [Puccinia sorghi]
MCRKNPALKSTKSLPETQRSPCHAKGSQGYILVDFFSLVQDVKYLSHWAPKNGAAQEMDPLKINFHSFETQSNHTGDPRYPSHI